MALWLIRPCVGLRPFQPAYQRTAYRLAQWGSLQRPNMVASSNPALAQMYLLVFLIFYSLVFIVICDLFGLTFLLITTSSLYIIMLSYRPTLLGRPIRTYV